MHLTTALFMASPWSAFAMIALIAIFVPTHAYETADPWLRDVLRPVDDWLVERYYDVLDRLDDSRFWLRDRIDAIRGR